MYIQYSGIRESNLNRMAEINYRENEIEKMEMLIFMLENSFGYEVVNAVDGCVYVIVEDFEDYEMFKRNYMRVKKFIQNYDNIALLKKDLLKEKMSQLDKKIGTELAQEEAQEEAEAEEAKYYTISVIDFKGLKKYFDQYDYNDMLDINPFHSGVTELLNKYRLYDTTFDVREYMGKYDSIKAIDEKTYEFEKNLYKDFYCEYRTFTIFYVDSSSTYETSVDDLSIFDAITSVQDELETQYMVDISKTLENYCVELGVSLKEFSERKSFRLKQCIREQLRILWEKRENEEN